APGIQAAQQLWTGDRGTPRCRTSTTGAGERPNREVRDRALRVRDRERSWRRRTDPRGRGRPSLGKPVQQASMPLLDLCGQLTDVVAARIPLDVHLDRHARDLVHGTVLTLGLTP